MIITVISSQIIKKEVEEYMMIDCKMPPRKMYQRVQEIYEFIRKNERVFKSDFEKIGLGGSSIEEWMKIFEYVRNQPEINVIRKGRYRIYEFQNAEEKE